MLPIDIRQGTAKDATLISNLIKDMVGEMALYGGHAINHSPNIWYQVAERVKVNSTRREYLYLIASHGAPPQTTVGLLAANIEPLEAIFTATSRLHLSAIYTVPNARQQGVAGQLIQTALEWGRQMNTTEADLNVLVGNPARRLYERLGFQPHEISMVKKLSNNPIADI